MHATSVPTASPQPELLVTPLAMMVGLRNAELLHNQLSLTLDEIPTIFHVPSIF